MTMILAVRDIMVEMFKSISELEYSNKFRSAKKISGCCHGR